MEKKIDFEQLTHEELAFGWQKFIGAVVKRVRKRAGLASLTPDEVNEIAAAFSSFKPGVPK